MNYFAKMSKWQSWRKRGLGTTNQDPENLGTTSLISVKALNGDKVTLKERQFMQKSTDKTLHRDAPLSPEQRSWLAYVRQKVIQYPVSGLQTLLLPEQEIEHSSNTPVNLMSRWFLLLGHIAALTADEHHVSIDKILSSLAGPSLDYFKPQVLEMPLKNKARTLVFCCIS